MYRRSRVRIRRDSPACAAPRRRASPSVDALACCRSNFIKKRNEIYILLLLFLKNYIKILKQKNITRILTYPARRARFFASGAAIA